MITTAVPSVPPDGCGKGVDHFTRALTHQGRRVVDRPDACHDAGHAKATAGKREGAKGDREEAKHVACWVGLSPLGRQHPERICLQTQLRHIEGHSLADSEVEYLRVW